MATGSGRGVGRRSSSDVDVFLPHSDGESTRYEPLALSGRVPQGPAAAHVTSRPRIPSVKEVGEKDEGPNWTMSSPAQNLAAALNDPSNREYDLFTRTWGMYFVPTAPLPPSTIPNIQLGDFLRYLKETSAVSLSLLVTMTEFVLTECIGVSVAVYYVWSSHQSIMCV